MNAQILDMIERFEGQAVRARNEKKLVHLNPDDMLMLASWTRELLLYRFCATHRDTLMPRYNRTRSWVSSIIE